MWPTLSVATHTAVNFYPTVYIKILYFTKNITGRCPVTKVAVAR